MMTLAAIDFLLNEAGINTKEKTLLNFRDKSCGGYPGNVSVTGDDRKTVVLPAAKRMQIKDFFTPPRCRICFDKMNVLCDIAVGDPWGINDYDKSRGETVFIARTEKGENLTRSALVGDCLIAHEICYDSILHGQHIEEKRRLWREFTGAWNTQGYLLPIYAERIAKIEPHPRASICRLIHHSMSLDGFKSREKLFKLAKNELRLKKISSLLKKPVRIAKKIKKLMLHR
jgi:coenzyme F420 hydrogenase subunit beta